MLIFKISTREIKEYIHILKQDDIKSILSSRGIDDDEIKKLLKDEKATKASKAST